VYCIQDYSELFSRYKPENLRKFKSFILSIAYVKKAGDSVSRWERNWNHAEWKVSVDDKKDGIKIWQRTTETGCNAMKAEGIIEHNMLSVFKLIGHNDYK
jgi:hypothetical protein